MPNAIPAAAAWIASALTTTGTATAAGGYIVTATAGGAAYAAIYAAAYIALTAAVVYGASVLQDRGDRNGGAFGDKGRTMMVRDSVAARRKIYGMILTTGMMYPVGVDGLKNESFHFGVIIASQNVHELGDIYVQDEVVPLDGSGDATGTYAGHVHIGKQTGGPGQAVDAAYATAFPGVWTAAHRGDGITYLAVRLKYSPDLFPSGIPTVKCMVKGAKVYDPRDGAQDPDDVSTWVYSQNAALCVADFIHDPYFGKGIPWSRINSAALIAAANICDENVTLDDGVTTEKRYALNGSISTDMNRDQILLDMVSAMGGTVVDSGGLWTIHAGAWRTPVATLGDGDMVGPHRCQPRMPRTDTYNGVKGVFISPINKWVVTDFPPIKNDTYRTWDGGIRLWKDVSFNFTTSAATVQRLAKLDLERGRQQITFTTLYNLKALNMVPGQVVLHNRPKLGWVNKPFEITEWSLQSYKAGEGFALGVAISWRETAAAVYDWSQEETQVDLAPNTALPDVRSVPTPGAPTLLTDSTTSVVQPDGAFVPRLKVSWNTPNNIYVEQGGLVRVEYKRNADADWIVWNEPRGDTLTDFITDVAVGIRYDVRIQFQNQIGVRGAYATTANYLIAGDNAAPSAVGTLTATAGTGKAISLDWPDSVEEDLGEYEIQRRLSPAGSWVKLAEVMASRFVDVEVDIGVPYDYQVRAIDRSENLGPFSNTATATPGTIIDGTAPANPLAPTFSSSTTYLAGDGTVLARLVINVGIFQTGTAVQNLLYRRNGVGNGWLIADQRSTGGGTSTIDDLTPGIAYDVAAQNFSAYGVGSAIITATGSSFNAPNKTGAPGVPTGLAHVSGSSAIYNRPALYQGSVLLPSCRHNWTAPADLDVTGYEYSLQATNAVPAPAAFITRVTDTEGFSSNLLFGPRYFFVRSIDRSGNRSAWVGDGIQLTAAPFYGFPIAASGTIAVQDKSAIDITGGTITGITDMTLADGGTGASDAAGARVNLGVRNASRVENVSGGGSSATFVFNHGIGVLQNNVLIACVDPAGDLTAYHNYSSGSNDANNTAFTVFHPTGGTIGGGNRRFTIHFLP